MMSKQTRLKNIYIFNETRQYNVHIFDQKNNQV